MAKKNSGGPELIARYNARGKRNLLLIAAGVALILILGIVFTALGETSTSIPQCFLTVCRLLGGQALDTTQKVILHYRLPRVVMAVVAGVGLSVSGTAMQGITGNPLVSPFTIGISNAAAFGASLAIVFGFGILQKTEFGTVLTAFLFAFACAAAVYLVSTRVGMSPESLVLTGIAINYLFSAATSVIQYFADEHQLAEAVDWTFGSFNGATWNQVAVVSSCVFICFLALFATAPALNVLSCGNDEVARSIGVNPWKTRVWVGVFSVFATAAVISFSGVIGFVGLAGPHIARLLIGGDHRYLFPFSAAVGAVLLLVADTIGRLLLAPVLIPVGIVVSFLGVPIFVNLILTQRKRAVG